MKKQTAKVPAARGAARASAQAAARAAGSRAGSAPLPSSYRPQLATLTKAPPSGDAWLFELKYDGFRIGCRIDRGEVRLLSRNGKDWTERFPTIRDAAARLGVERALLDGELTMLLPDGRTSFQALQNAGASAARRGRLVYFVFDLLHCDGEDVGKLALEERKARLRALVGGRASGVIRYADHVVGHGADLFARACRDGGEGIIAKQRSRPYRVGRSTEWLKIKCIARQEMVVGGFTDPEGTRAGIGALLMGVYDDGDRLRFSGKVGTGFTQSTALSLRAQLERLERRDCPFDPPPPSAVTRRAHWVAPRLVAEIAFTEWTSDGRIRHPSFQGLREDKSARSVRRERAATNG